MRIVAGKWRGRRLASFEHPGIRPTTDRTREAIFSAIGSLLAAGGRAWEECPVADLYAGTGALGLEALSRGAPSAVFVDADAKAVALVRRNIGALGAEEQARVERADAGKWLAAPPRGAPVQLLFADPPYEAGGTQRLLDLVPGSARVAPGALLVIERSTRKPPLELPPGITRVKSRAYGDSTVEFLEKGET